MQLLQTRTIKTSLPSTEYLKQSLSAIEKFESKAVMLVILSHRFFSPVSIPEFYEWEELPETSTILQPQRLIRKLENIYIFDDPKEIKNFLLDNDYLIEILFEAPGHIFKIFGQVPIYLELHRDPEEDWDELFIIIRSPYNPKKAIQLKNQLVEEWFLDRMKATQGKLNIAEEPL